MVATPPAEKHLIEKIKGGGKKKNLQLEDKDGVTLPYSPIFCFFVEWRASLFLPPASLRRTDVANAHKHRERERERDK